MKFSYNLLQELIDGELPKNSELADLLSLHSYECESVNGDILDLDILPNRASDSSCHLGVARDIAVLLKTKLKDIQKENLQFQSSHNNFSVNIENKDLCSRYCAVKIDGVKVEESPSWLKDRLNALGLNSINNIVDIGNYVMLITGQPIHIFNADKIDEKIIIRKAKDGEIIDALDDKSYSLKKEFLVIADGKDVLAIAGIKGGKKASVDSNTKNIIIEAANFNPRSIRNTSRMLHLSTDASFRFERKVPVSFCELGICVIAKMLKDISGGKVDGDVVDINFSEINSPEIVLNQNYLNNILGCDIPTEEVEGILRSLEFSVDRKGDDLIVVPPDFRLDVTIGNDVIEEVARIKGYDYIPSVVPKALVKPVPSNNKRFVKRDLIKSMAGFGFVEVHTISFVEDALMSKWGSLGDMMLRLENPIQENVSFLRPSLLPNCVEVAYDNIKYEDRVQLFEISKIFSDMGDIKEYDTIAFVIVSKKKTKDIFYELKGVVERMFSGLGIKNYSIERFDECNMSFIHPLQSAQIKIDGKFVGMLGMLHPYLLKNLNINTSVVVCEMKFEDLLDARQQKIYKQISKYPKMVRDISIFVPNDTIVKDIEDDIYNICGEELVGVDLFDYRVDEGKLSVAFHLVFQLVDRTLKSEEADKKMESIINFIEKDKGWKVR